MDNFVVSARKYRPSTFQTVVGQHSITTTLKNAIKQQQLAQAFLFCGPRGVGKTTCARILAKTINCKNLTENFEPCNTCDSCKSFNELTSFNIHELDAASNNSVDDIRALVEQVRIPPQAGKYKVYIIDEVHMLSQAAFNAFLKTLEEPPAYAKFILATTEKHKILPTILSRCQIFDFKRITVDDIAKHLEYVAECENIAVEPDALHLIAQKADGALRDALSIFDQITISSGNNITYQAVIDNLNILDYDYYFKMTDMILNGEIFNALNLVEKVIENGFDGQLFLSGYASHLRNLLVCKDTATLKLLEVGDNIKKRYVDMVARCSEDFLIRSLDISNKFDFDYKSSNNKRLHFEIAIIKMCRLQQSVDSATEQKKKSEPEITSDTPKVATSESSVKPRTGVATPPTKAVLNPGMIVSLKPQSQKEESAVVSEPSVDYGNNDFDSGALEQAWLESIKQFDKQPAFYTALKMAAPVQDSENNYVVTFDNNTMMQEFISKKPAILHNIKTLLKNNAIELTEKIGESGPIETTPYTSEDKYKKMLEKNPNLGLFKDKLELDLNY